MEDFETRESRILYLISGAPLHHTFIDRKEPGNFNQPYVAAIVS